MLALLLVVLLMFVCGVIVGFSLFGKVVLLVFCFVVVFLWVLVLV